MAPGSGVLVDTRLLGSCGLWRTSTGHSILGQEGVHGDHYELNRDTQNVLEMRKRANETQWDERKRKIQRKREDIHIQKWPSLDSAISSLHGSCESIISDKNILTSSSMSRHSSVNSFQIITNFQLVLLGHRGAGQTSSANTILGVEEFGYGPLSHCVKRSTQVCDRCVSVVCTPGWEKTERCYNTLDQNKQIVSSVDLCSPGPHVFLLVLQAPMSFSAETLQAMEEHMELLGKNVWDYTMLLFTHGDRLGDTTIEQHIESEGEALKKLVERCGNRYHVLDNYNRDADSQVADLLEKVEEMVMANGGYCFEVNEENLEEEKRRKEWRKEEASGKQKDEQDWREEKELGKCREQVEKNWKVLMSDWWRNLSDIKALSSNKALSNRKRKRRGAMC